MNLPSANRLWSETSEITSVFRRGYLMTDSHGVYGILPHINKIWIILILKSSEDLALIR